MIGTLGLFVAGLVAVAAMFLHPVGPALALLGLGPFEGVLFVLFGPLGNVLTYLPILIFAVRVSPALWSRVFLSTRIQQIATGWMVVLIISHIVSVRFYGTELLIAYGRKLTYVVVLGVFAWSLRDPRHIGVIIKTLVITSAVFIGLSAMDFYLGVQILPVAAGEWGEQGAFGVEHEGMLASDLRFLGAGLTVNRTANYLIVPILLGVGWVSSARSPAGRVLAIGCVLVLGLGLIGTTARSSIIGVGAAGLLLMGTAYRFRPQQVLAMGFVAASFLFVIWIVSSFLGTTENVAMRFDPATMVSNFFGRFNRVMAGLVVWANSPLIGVGEGAFSIYSRPVLESWGDFGGSGAHNSYVLTLAESGIIGAIPFYALILVTLRRLTMSAKSYAPEMEYWRPFFLSAFLAELLAIWFNVYHWERIFWFNLAFAVALEHNALAARSRMRAEFGQLGQPEAAPQGAFESPPQGFPLRSA